MVYATAASAASNQVLNALAKTEIGNLSRQRVLNSESSQQTWANFQQETAHMFEKAAAGGSAALGSAATESAASSATSTTFFTEMISSLTQGVTSSVRKVFSTMTDATSAFSDSLGNTAVWMMKKKGEFVVVGNDLLFSPTMKELITKSKKEVLKQNESSSSSNEQQQMAFSSLGAFNTQQEHFLSGLVSSLHHEHLFALTEAQKKTLMLCGVTVLASCGIAAVTTYFLVRNNANGGKKNVSSSDSDSSTSSSSSASQPQKKVMKIKNLNFKGSPDEFVAFLEKLQQKSNGGSHDNDDDSFLSDLKIEIENASVESPQEHEQEEDSFVTEVVYPHRHHQEGAYVVNNNDDDEDFAMAY